MRGDSWCCSNTLKHVVAVLGAVLSAHSSCASETVMSGSILLQQYVGAFCLIYTHLVHYRQSYVVATINRLLKIIGLFCKRALLKRRYSAKETYNFKEPTNRSHHICGNSCIDGDQWKLVVETHLQTIICGI